MASDRKQYLGFGGLHLAAEIWGDPEAPPALFLHGGGQTRHAWGGSAERLGRSGWQAIALDLRGHGDSDWAPDGAYSMDAFVGDLLAVTREIGRPPALVGASLGGLTALLACGETDPPPATALVLVDVAPRMEPEGVARIIEFMLGHPDGFANLDEAVDAVAAYATHRPRPRSPEGLRKNLRLGDDGRYRWHWDPRFLGDRLRPRATRNVDRLENAARALTIPTLLVRGGASDVVSEEGVQEFLGLVPNARYIDVAGAGHMVAGDRNDVFADAVLEFLGGISP